MAEAQIDLPDGMRWTFTVDGVNMNPSIWPTTDGGTAIKIQWDEKNTGIQDDLEKQAQAFLEKIRSFHIVE